MNGPFGNGFPYVNFHDLNLDWIIKIAKDFLDQYSTIQDTITQGLEDLDTKATELQGLLDAWYDEHSQDIADQLADTLEDLNAWYTEHQDFLDQYVTDSISAFNTAADTKAAAAIASIPADYSALSAGVGNMAEFQASGKYEKTFTYDSSEFNYLSDTVVFAKGHRYEYYMSGSILNGSGCQFKINGVAQQGLSDPRTHRFITPEDDVFEWGYYVPAAAVSGTGDIKLIVIDRTAIPNNQIESIIGNNGNKYPINILQGYTSDASNTYSVAEKYNNYHVEATLVSGSTLLLYAGITANKKYRIGLKINSGSNTDIRFIASNANSSWNGQNFLPGPQKAPGTYFIEASATDTASKTYLIIQLRNGTAADFDIYLANPDSIDTFNFAIGEQGVYQAYKSEHSKFAESVGKGTDTQAIFWGDSITAGAGASAYEDCFVSKYAEMMGFNSIINAGVGGETIYTIAARQGGNTVFAPAGNPSTNSFPLVDPLGNYVRPLVGGYLVGNVDPYTRTVKLNNVAGNLSRLSADNYQIAVNTNLLNETPIQFPGQNYTGDITIIFAGTNNWDPEKPTQDIDYINMMLQNITNKKYIIMGIYKAYNETYENAMFAAFGNHFFNTRKMLSEYGLTVENIVPTEEDTEAMQNHLVPPSLLSDEIHPNDYGHEAIAKFLYQHTLFLGYNA